MLHATAAFPDRYAALPTASLLESYRTAPARLRDALAGLPHERLRARPIAGKWSILEITLHLTDSELMGAGRFRFALAQPGVRLIGYDQDVWTPSLAHNDATPAALAASLALFETIRANLLHLLDGIPAAWWTERHAIHPEMGLLTLRNLLELYADHGERHLQQILERRRLLGAPVDVPVLLPERLY